MKCCNAMDFKTLKIITLLTCCGMGLCVTICPHSCDCRVEHKVDCSGRNLTTIPKIGKDVLTLDMSNNRIAKVDFANIPVANQLRYLLLQNNSIVSLEKSQFSRLPELATLDLSHNSLTTLPDRLCDHMPSIREIVLSFNNIKLLPPAGFALCERLLVLDLSYNQITDQKGLWQALYAANTLEHLDLSGNEINRIIDNKMMTMSNLLILRLSAMKLRIISDHAFSGLDKLQSLDMSKNALSTLEPIVFESLPNLWQLNLQGVKFLCDCTMRNLTDMFVRRSITLNGKAECYVPKLNTPFDLRFTDMSQFCRSQTSNGPSVSPEVTPEATPEVVTKTKETPATLLPPSDCKRLKPYEVKATNVTSTTTNLLWRSNCVIGGVTVKISSRNIDNGQSIIKTIIDRVDVSERKYFMQDLNPHTYYAVCISMKECNYETCAVFTTLTDGPLSYTTIASAPLPKGHSTEFIIGIVVTILIVMVLLGLFIFLSRTSDKFYYFVFNRVRHDMKMAPNLSASQASLMSNGRVNGAYKDREDGIIKDENYNTQRNPQTSIHNPSYLKVVDIAANRDIEMGAAGKKREIEKDYMTLNPDESLYTKERKYAQLKPVPGQILPGRTPHLKRDLESQYKRQPYEKESDYLQPNEISSDGSDSPDMNDPLYLEYDDSPRPPRYSQIHNLYLDTANGASCEYLKADDLNPKNSSSPSTRKRAPKMGVQTNNIQSIALPPVPVDAKQVSCQVPVSTHPANRQDSLRSETYEELDDIDIGIEKTLPRLSIVEENDTSCSVDS